MLSTDVEGILGLVGVAQAAALTQQIAKRGYIDKQACESSLSSILVTDSDTPQQIFGQLDNLKIGFGTLYNQLSDNPKSKNTEITRYMMSLLKLERKLAKKPASLNELRQRISHVQRQLAHVDFENPQILSSLAAVYSDVISPLSPRIQVAGSPTHLGIPLNQHRVRALLLAGVRAAVLWRQMGGRRRNIVLQRKTILASAEKALRIIN